MWSVSDELMTALPKPTYKTDFYGWARMEAKLLRERKLNELDFDNLIEEIEDMGASKENQLTNRVTVLIAHLLKWQFQPDRSIKSGRSWFSTIGEQRDRIIDLIAENQSLASNQKQPECLKKYYECAKKQFQTETKINSKILPAQCPYTFEQLMDDEFFPEAIK